MLKNQKSILLSNAIKAVRNTASFIELAYLFLTFELHILFKALIKYTYFSIANNLLLMN